MDSSWAFSHDRPLLNSLFPNFYLRFACLAGHEECALPLQAAHEARHAVLGRMPAGMCTWSGARCPSIVSTPFHWHGCLRISPRSSRHWLQMAFLLYSGQNTMWHLHIHLVCARLLAFCAIALSFLSRPATRTITILEGEEFRCIASLPSTRTAGGFLCRACRAA